MSMFVLFPISSGNYKTIKRRIEIEILLIILTKIWFHDTYISCNAKDIGVKMLFLNESAHQFSF